LRLPQSVHQPDPNRPHGAATQHEGYEITNQCAQFVLLQQTRDLSTQPNEFNIHPVFRCWYRKYP